MSDTMSGMAQAGVASAGGYALFVVGLLLGGWMGATLGFRAARTQRGYQDWRDTKHRVGPLRRATWALLRRLGAAGSIAVLLGLAVVAFGVAAR